MARLRLQVLGAFQATLDGAPLGLESNKVRALLIYLAMESGRAHSREVLAEMFWPNQPQRLAMSNLRYALADLRSNLGEKAGNSHFVTVARDTVQFNSSSDTWLDAVVLRTLADPENTPNSSSISNLERAASLYQGSFLEGFSVRNSEPFEEWMLDQREQLTRCVQKALSALAGHYERHGDFQRALALGRRQLEIEPWDEEVHQQVMRLLAFDGQRSAALAQYETCKSLLCRELDVGPSTQTTALYESIRDGTLYIPLHFVRSEAAASSATGPQLPFVAREQELSALTRHLERALGGQGCVAFVTGEAGSGKTMLAKEFLRRSGEAHSDLVTLYGNCNSLAGSIDPYLPFIEVFRMLAGDVEMQHASGSADREQSRRLWNALPVVIRALVESGPDLIDRFVPGGDLIARARALEHFQTGSLERLLRSRAGTDAQSEPGAGPHRQSELFEQVGGVLRAVARTHPVLLGLDDLQWADQDTVNLLFYLCRRLTGSRIMIVGMYRLEDAAGAAGTRPSPLFPALHELQAAFGEAAIDLSRSDARHFVNALLDREPNALDETFRKALEQHTDGIPLFVVELVRGMQEHGDLIRDGNGRWVASQTLDWEALPPRVEAVIAQQVERLPKESRLLLSVASVEGDEFSAEILAHVLNRHSGELVTHLSGSLSRLHHMIVPLGVQRVGQAGSVLSRYRFRHHLFQRYFESSQDIIERSHFHAAVGNALETLYGEQADEIAVPLARHFEFANLGQKAAKYLLMAGKRAQRLFADEEAIAHFRRALNLIAFLPEGPERDRLELQLQTALTVPLVATQGYTSTELERACVRARQLLDRCGNSRDLFQVLSMLKSYYNLRGDRRNSEETAQALREIADADGDPELLVVAATKMVTNSFYYGQWTKFREWVGRTLQLYDPEKHRTLIYKIGGDPKGMALAYGGVGLWMLGFSEQARRYTRSALELERDVAAPLWSLFAFYYVAYYHICAEELETARHWIDEVLHVCNDQGMSHYRLYMEGVRGWLMARAGDKTGISGVERGTAWAREMGDLMNSLTLLRLLADAYLTHRLIPEGLETIEKALAISRETEMVFEEPELWRLKGELLLAGSGDNVVEAEGCFLRAIDSAHAQGTRMWELRATVSLARLWKQQGRREEARGRLEALYSWFTEGFETRDLQRAKSLLDELKIPES